MGPRQQGQIYQILRGTLVLPTGAEDLPEVVGVTSIGGIPQMTGIYSGPGVARGNEDLCVSVTAP
jgi:hypothetical protein